MKWEELLNGQRLRALMDEPPKAPAYDDFRSPIEQDYGRAVFCTPVRRLQDKAQVFPLEQIDGVRTRLTHSLEVSSVSRSIARRICSKLQETGELNAAASYNVETIAATCGLLHDIGNPPFGHFGETSIQTWFKSSSLVEKLPAHLKADFHNFEGNAQTFRLVTRLQVLADLRGLNLTAATLSALQKYTASSTETATKQGHSKSKIGYFQSETHEIKAVRSATGTGDYRNPIAALVEASDDLVYLSVDLEDAIKKRVLNWAQFREFLAKYSPELMAEVDSFAKACGLSILDLDVDESCAQYFRTIFIRNGAKLVIETFLRNYSSIMDGSWDKELLYSTSESTFFEAFNNYSVQISILQKKL